MPFPEFLGSLQDNPYFGAGFGLVGVGAGLAVLRKASMFAMIFLRRRYFITLEVPCRDRSYQWLLPWMTAQVKTAQHVSVETLFQQQETGKVISAFKFIPGVGTHYFWYDKRLFKIERSRENTLDLHMGLPFETVTLTTYGRDRNIFYDMLSQARDSALEAEEGKTIIYKPAGSEWRQFGHPRNRRPIASVILHEGISDRILRDVKDFIDDKEYYTERGIPYRRGYLLFGPPGCGKSSYITALAGELQYSICILNLSERSLSDDRLQHLMNAAPQQSIILLEDIDAAFVDRADTPKTKVAYEGLNQVTFSGVLNMLDGVASSEARILFMTTNYKNRLDNALLRPGRIDVQEFIDYASDYQMKIMYEKFYRDPIVKKDSLAAKFIEKVKVGMENVKAEKIKEMEKVKKGEIVEEEKKKFKEGVSPADIQGLFMLYKNDPKGVIENVEKMFEF